MNSLISSLIIISALLTCIITQSLSILEDVPEEVDGEIQVFFYDDGIVGFLMRIKCIKTGSVMKWEIHCINSQA